MINKNLLSLTLIFALSATTAQSNVPSLTTKNISNAQNASAALATVLTLRKVLFQPRGKSEKYINTMNIASQHTHGILNAITEDDNGPMALTRILQVAEKDLSENRKLHMNKISVASAKKLTDLKLLGSGLLFGITQEAITQASNRMIKKYCSQKQLRRILRVGTSALASIIAEKAYHHVTKMGIDSYFKTMLDKEVKDGSVTKKEATKMLASDECKTAKKAQFDTFAEISQAVVIREAITQAFYEVAAEIITRYAIEDEQALQKAIDAA